MSMMSSVRLALGAALRWAALCREFARSAVGWRPCVFSQFLAQSSACISEEKRRHRAILFVCIQVAGLSLPRAESSAAEVVLIQSHVSTRKAFSSWTSNSCSVSSDQVYQGHSSCCKHGPTAGFAVHDVKLSREPGWPQEQR